MARCGCGSGTGSATCNCRLVDGDGTTSSGAGTDLAPYRVNVLVDPAAGNLVKTGPAGLLVECEDVQDCVGQGFNQGLAYDDATNQFNARPSTAPGNTITFGPDGGLFAAAGAFSCDSLSACSINSLADVDTATDAPEASNLLMWNGTQWVPSPAGCGLEVVGGSLQAKTGDFASIQVATCNGLIGPVDTDPIACPDTAGSIVYCDTTGQLRGQPEKFGYSNVASINEAFMPAQSLPFTTTEQSYAVTNPSECYCLCGYMEVACVQFESSTGNAQPQMFYQVDTGTGVFQEFGVALRDTRGIASATQDRTRYAALLNVCIPPGATRTLRYRVRWDYGSGHAGGTTQILAAARELRFYGSNL